MAINIIEKFKTADTSKKLRAITVEEIKTKGMTTVHAENLQRELLSLADEKELEELEQTFSPVIKAEFPNALIETTRTNKSPCVLVSPPTSKLNNGRLSLIPTRPPSKIVTCSLPFLLI